MSEWIAILDSWENFSPFLKRNLITREEIWGWIEKLKYSSFSSEKDAMLILMDYLEKENLFHPIFYGKKGSKIPQDQEKYRGIIYTNKPTKEELEQKVKLYHPFQFFQFILYWKNYKENSSKKSRFQFYYQKKDIQSGNSWYFDHFFITIYNIYFFQDS